MQSTTPGPSERSLHFVWLGCGDAIRGRPNIRRAKAVFGIGLRQVRPGSPVLFKASGRYAARRSDSPPSGGIPERPAYLECHLAEQIQASQELLRVLGRTRRDAGVAAAADSSALASNIRSLRLFSNGTTASIEGNAVQSETARMQDRAANSARTAALSLRNRSTRRRGATAQVRGH